jgi:transposase
MSCWRPAREPQGHRDYYGLSANVRKLGGMGRHELSDTQWRQLAPHLPPEKPRVGRPAHPHRRIINGILWILATGAPWRGLPAQYGSWQTVSSRFYRWRRAGI